MLILPLLITLPLLTLIFLALSSRVNVLITTNGVYIVSLDPLTLTFLLELLVNLTSIVTLPLLPASSLSSISLPSNLYVMLALTGSSFEVLPW